jgi:dTMP kinase
MKDQEGIFLVLEGADGSGKGTQFKLLSERLRAVGYDIEVFDFPRYEEPSSHFVRKYLNGEYGKAADISPYTSALFFALDRYEASPKIKEALSQGKIVLSNRYVGSNMAHMGGKFTNSGEQRGFFIWEDSLEFQMLGIPRPTLNIFLRVPADVSYELIAKKAQRSYTDKNRDEHEGDLNHLKRSVETYDTLCKLFPKDFKAIECAPDGKLMSIAEINDKIWNQIKPLLPPKPPHAGRNVVFNLNDEAKQKPVKESLKENPILREPQPEMIQPQSPEIESGNLTIQIKKVSLLAARQVQAVNGVRCEINSTQWPADGAYNFYTPSNMSKKILDDYKKSLEKIASLHKQIIDEIGKNKSERIISQLNALMPLAALVSIKITASEDDISNLVSQMRLNPHSEVKWLAEQVQTIANQQRPGKFNTLAQKEILDSSDDPLSKLASTLEKNKAEHIEKASLQEAWPRNEFSLLVDALYPYSASSRNEISSQTESWNYDQKQKTFYAALAANNSSILDAAHYRWDAVAQSKVLNNLKQALDMSELQTKPFTPAYGYDVPEEIESAGVDELYIECFDESLKLYSALKEETQNAFAEYVVLTGFKSRWQFTTTAKNIKNALSKTTSANAKEILNLMLEKISEHHPLIGEHISQPAASRPNEQNTFVKKLSAIKKPTLPRRRRSRKPKK